MKSVYVCNVENEITEEPLIMPSCFPTENEKPKQNAEAKTEDSIKETPLVMPSVWS